VSVFEIVTERLSLRPFRVDDLAAFVAYRSDPEVARYQSWDSTYSMAMPSLSFVHNATWCSVNLETGYSWRSSMGRQARSVGIAQCAS